MEKKYGTTKITDQIISFWELLLMIGLVALGFLNIYTGELKEIIIFSVIIAGFLTPIFREVVYNYTGLIIKDEELKFIGSLNKEKVVTAGDIYEVAINAHSKKLTVIKFFYNERDKYLSQKFDVSGMEDLEELVEKIRDFSDQNGIDRTEILKKDLTGDTAQIVEEIDFEKVGVKYNRSRDFFDNEPDFMDLGFGGFMIIVVIVNFFPVLPVSLGIKAIIVLLYIGLIVLFYKRGYDLLHSALFSFFFPTMVFLFLGFLVLLVGNAIDFLPI